MPEIPRVEIYLTGNTIMTDEDVDRLVRAITRRLGGDAGDAGEA